jgi:hypothetical protein
MSFRGSFVTQYLYGEASISAVHAALSRREFGIVTTVVLDTPPDDSVPGPQRRQIIAGFVKASWVHRAPDEAESIQLALASAVDRPPVPVSIVVVAEGGTYELTWHPDGSTERWRLERVERMDPERK